MNLRICPTGAAVHYPQAITTQDKLLRPPGSSVSALTHNYLGNQQRVLELFNAALARANALGDEGKNIW